MKSFAHEIAGMPVHASDGDIGTIKDVVFDPRRWIVRYLEVSTGWLFGRDVLIPVDKVKAIDAPEGAVTFDLTREEIENSPDAEPESRADPAHESRLMGYYGLSPSWAAPPDAGVPPDAVPPEAGSSDVSRGPQLFFASEIDGYELDAQGEAAGTVRDVLIDLESWKVTSLMADLGGLFTPDSIDIGIAPVTGIDRANRIVHIALAKEVVDRSHRTGLDDLPYVFPYVPPIV
jgi:uncharacterized protein YrrD